MVEYADAQTATLFAQPPPSHSGREGIRSCTACTCNCGLCLRVTNPAVEGVQETRTMTHGQSCEPVRRQSRLEAEGVAQLIKASPSILYSSEPTSLARGGPHLRSLLAKLVWCTADDVLTDLWRPPRTASKRQHVRSWSTRCSPSPVLDLS